MWVKKTTTAGFAAPCLRRNASAIAARRHCGYGATPLRLWRKEDAVVVQRQMGEPAKLLGCWSFGLRPAVLECHSSPRMNASRQLHRGRPGVFGHRSPTRMNAIRQLRRGDLAFFAIIPPPTRTDTEQRIFRGLFFAEKGGANSHLPFSSQLSNVVSCLLP